MANQAVYNKSSSDSNRNKVWDTSSLSWVAMTQPLIKTDSLTVAGEMSISNFPASQAVTGAFWQATQPISAVALPLPNGAATSDKQEGFSERLAFNALRRLSIDASGRLRIAAESVASHAVTLTTLTNLTNWGLSTATAKSQWESNLQYQSGYRRNLVKS